MKVLVTRRKSDSLRTGAALRKAGLEPVILPLFELVATGRDRPPGTPDFLVFTSAAALEVSGTGPGNFDADIPVYCVGPHTGQMARNAGYNNIRQGSGDAGSLAQMIFRDFQNNGNGVMGLYPCAVERSFDFQPGFGDTLVHIELWEVYEIVPVVPQSAELERALLSAQNGCILMFSSATARHFLNLVKRFALEDLVKSFKFLTISEKTALTADVGLAKSVHLSQTPDEKGLVALAAQLSKADPMGV